MRQGKFNIGVGRSLTERPSLFLHPDSSAFDRYDILGLLIVRDFRYV